MAMIGFVSINNVIVQKSIVGQILDVENLEKIIGRHSYRGLFIPTSVKYNKARYVVETLIHGTEGRGLP